MSPANVKYLLKQNPQIPAEIVEVCPNCIEPDLNGAIGDKTNLKGKYKIQEGATFFIYGGNLGRPQGLDFLPEVLESNKFKPDRFFIVIGKGTEQSKIANWFKSKNPSNAVYLNSLPKNEYDRLIKSCDVGLIFLDKRFTIPNFPSRLLSYLETFNDHMNKLSHDSDLFKSMSKSGYDFLLENYTVAVSYQKIVNHFN